MNKYWFRKRLGIRSRDAGWGWVPITWEGWLTLTSLFALIGIVGFVLGIFSEKATIADVILFLILSAILVLFTAILSWKKTKPEN